MSLLPVSSFVQLFQTYQVRDRVVPSSKHLLLCFLLPFWWGLRCSSVLLVLLLHRVAQCCAVVRIAVFMPIFRNLIACLSAICFVIQERLPSLPFHLLFTSKNDTFSHNPYDPVMLCLVFTLVPRDTPSLVGSGLNQKSFWWLEVGHFVPNLPKLFLKIIWILHLLHPPSTPWSQQLSACFSACYITPEISPPSKLPASFFIQLQKPLVLGLRFIQAFHATVDIQSKFFLFPVKEPHSFKESLWFAGVIAVRPSLFAIILVVLQFMR